MEFLKSIHLIHSSIGLFHTLAALSAMFFGTWVFLTQKGTTKHKKLGYVYIASMLLMNLSGFGIYNFGGFSLFHAFILLSLFSIAMGILPAIRRKNDQWLYNHFYFMNWSVVGLYCAFWAEIGVRLFDMRYFWWVVMLATMLTSTLGAIVINREAKKLKQIGTKKT